ncbi:MAG: hypothetical protein ACK4TO_08545, partial [Candidatus Nitrosotenuis sp.]
MSSFQPKNGRNWYSAMGILFIVVGAIVMVRNLFLWSPEFVLDFLLNSEVTNEKISVGMFIFGGFLLILGFRVLLHQRELNKVSSNLRNQFLFQLSIN